MTVKTTGYKRKMIGLAADIRPTLCPESTQLIEPGSEFYVLDTYTTYIFDGIGTWYASPALVSTS